MLVMMTAILMSFASAAQSPCTPDVVIVNAKLPEKALFLLLLTHGLLRFFLEAAPEVNSAA